MYVGRSLRVAASLAGRLNAVVARGTWAHGAIFSPGTSLYEMRRRRAVATQNEGGVVPRGRSAESQQVPVRLDGAWEDLELDVAVGVDRQDLGHRRLSVVATNR